MTEQKNIIDKKKPCSMALSLTLIEALKVEAQKKGMSTSSIVEKLLKKQNFYKSFIQQKNGSN